MPDAPQPGVTDRDGGSDAGGDLLLDSLQRRMHALFSLYYDAVATMDLDQVNHFEREGVLPIAFSLFHIVNMIDASFLLMTGTPPIWQDCAVRALYRQLRQSKADAGTNPRSRRSRVGMTSRRA